MIWAAIAGCLMVSFIFSGIEAGILSMNRVRLKHRLKLRDRAAITLNRLLERPERLLVTVLLVTNLMNIFAITLATQEFVMRFGDRVGYAAAFIIFLPVYLLGLELLPKSFFRRFPYRAVAALAGPLRLADGLLSPIHYVGQTVSGLLFGARPEKRQKLFVAREDFKYLTIESERVGTLSKTERQMIHNVIDFRALKAADLMSPISETPAISVNAALEDLIARARETNRERWPAVDEHGKLVGIVEVFDIAIEGRQRGVVETYLRRIVHVTADEPAFNILRKLRAARVTLAVVENGAEQVGLVSWEALVRRLLAIGEGRS
jgi:CBS domain containing-hemolysin-like protein